MYHYFSTKLKKISAIIKDNNNDKCIYAATTDGQIYKTIGGDQKFEELLTTGSKITDLTFDNLGNVYATDMSGQVWKKDNNKNYFFRFQLHPLSNCLTSIVINNDNCIYIYIYILVIILVIFEKVMDHQPLINFNLKLILVLKN
ncbi:hypothetical protein [Spiroplasma endosymbiont of Amphimallon solstitiale]|uniref:hypothetical protein n=1 Tax=Spiroplasma endosymbiont of Amphimallon solstitiale TaxID=3066288 RepID=UPI00313B3F13